VLCFAGPSVGQWGVILQQLCLWEQSSGCEPVHSCAALLASARDVAAASRLCRSARAAAAAAWRALDESLSGAAAAPRLAGAECGAPSWQALIEQPQKAPLKVLKAAAAARKCSVKGVSFHTICCMFSLAARDTEFPGICKASVVQLASA
jgi:hypothetical protein